MVTETEKFNIYKSVFGDNAQCYHHPELKKLVFLCMDEAVRKVQEDEIREAEKETIIDP